MEYALACVWWWVTNHLLEITFTLFKINFGMVKSDLTTNSSVWLLSTQINYGSKAKFTAKVYTLASVIDWNWFWRFVVIHFHIYTVKHILVIVALSKRNKKTKPHTRCIVPHCVAYLFFWDKYIFNLLKYINSFLFLFLFRNYINMLYF